MLEPRRSRLLALAEAANQRGWWEEYADALPPEYLEYIGLEAEAESLVHWAITGVPGLLQTEDYLVESSLPPDESRHLIVGTAQQRWG